jgi:tetratricopeptide (TPR) repeat protein
VKVGPYEVERELGRGAMGAVFLARDPRSGARVVVKTLIVPDPTAAERFDREGRIGLALRHPGIVATLEVGRDAARGPYVVMEHADGPTLRDVLTKGPLEPDHAAKLVREVALALEHAHRSGVVHRDLKPANVILDARGHPRILDFGLSRAAWEPSLSATGEIAGTPSYVPPEQVTGGSRAHGVPGDVWALGVLLHEALAGEVPFRAGSMPALLSAIAREPASPLPPHVPSRLAALVRRCLEKDPAKRWPSAAAVAAELASLDERAPASRGMTLALGGVLLVVVVALGVTAALRRPASPASLAPPRVPPVPVTPTRPVADPRQMQLELIDRGRELDDLGCCEAAIAAFTSAIALGPSADALFGRVQARRRVPNFREHLSDITRDVDAACELERGTVRARLYRESGGADQLAREVPDDPLVVENRYGIARGEERLEDALRLAEHLIAVSKERFFPRILHSATLTAMGRVDEAISELDSLIREAPRSSYALYIRARAHHVKGDDTGYAADLDEAIRVDPMGYDARIERASTLPDNPARSFALLDEILAFEPRDVAALHESGAALVTLGDEPSGFARLERARELFPEDVITLETLAKMHWLTRDHGDHLRLAEHYAGEVLVRNPGSVIGLAVRGRVRARRGDTKGALEDLEKVLPRFVDPGDREETSDVIRQLKGP